MTIPLPPRPTTINSRRWLALALLSAAQFMLILDFSIVNVALPSIQRDLGFSAQNLQSIISAYALTIGGFLLLGGQAADLFGRRRVLIVGLGLFSLASLVGGFAQSQWILVDARAIQGLGGALISPAVLSILITTFPKESERNRALGIAGAVSAGGFTAGVILGGLLTDLLNWRWVMFVNVPIAMVAIALAPVLLSQEKTAPRQINFLSALAVISGLTALVYTLVKAPFVGWVSLQTIVSLALSVALLGTFVGIQSRSKTRFVPLSFRRQTLIGANIVAALVNAAAASNVFILTLYMQQVLHYSAFQTGIAFLPHSLAAIAAAPISSQLMLKFGVKKTLMGGLVLEILGFLLLTGISVEGNFGRELLPGTVILGLAFVISIITVTIAATAGVSDSEQGLASGLLNTTQQIGAGIGLAILVAVSTTRTKALTASLGNTTAAMLGGFQWAIAVGAGFAAISLIVALFVIRNSECHRQVELHHE